MTLNGVKIIDALFVVAALRVLAVDTVEKVSS